MSQDGKILELLLKELGIKKGTLARMTDVVPNTVTNWIKADIISNQNLIEIGKALRYDMTQRFPRLKKVPEATELDYFNSDPAKVLEDLKEIKELKEQYEKKDADARLEINFLKERIENLQDLIAAKNAIIKTKDDLIESRNQRVKELEKELARLKDGK